MRTGKGNQEDEYEEEEFSSKKDGTSSTDKDNTSNRGFSHI